MVRERLIAGCMTGTSIDGIDAALVRIRGEGLAITAEVVKTASRSLSPSLAVSLRKFGRQETMSAEKVARLADALGNEHAGLLGELLVEERADLVAVHGQTVFHRGHSGRGGQPMTWQMLNVWPIVRSVGCAVVFDLRSADLAAGGEGAPITPVTDWVMFRDQDRRRVVLNLGGFCNYTWIPAGTGIDSGQWLEGVRGGDVCVCNQLLDQAAGRVLGKRYDEGGEAAMCGSVDSEGLKRLHAVLLRQSSGGRSLGTGDECFDLIKQLARRASGGDLLRTLCAAIGGVVAGTASNHGAVGEIVLAGGGARNRALVLEIERAASSHGIGRVLLSDELGVGVGYREAAAMAVLGALAQDGVPLTLPAVTGRRPEVGRFGCWVYP